MTTWAEFEAAEPAFAGRVRALFEAHKHHTMATIRRDGSPRISGTEVRFEDGEMVLGMMAGDPTGSRSTTRSPAGHTQPRD
ncbi:MAG TPA: hypothetical protein VK428_09860 [Acidimicrobiales bacterium]|nr:hypothetical protein [Acidimicrobiales bacterium]